MRRLSITTALAVLLSVPATVGQAVEAAPHDAAPAPDAAPAGQGLLRLSAVVGGDPAPLGTGMRWSVFDERTDQDGTHRIVAQSSEAQPAFTLPDGAYVVHVTYGFASQMKRVVVTDKAASERLTLNAGALEVDGRLGDAAIAADRLSVAIYVPEHGNPQAKLVVANAKPGEILRLPEGMYHITSTYLDTVGVGSLVPVSNSNSVVNADLRVQAGKFITATVKHRAAVMTLKLVNQPGGEALADTGFTILTPGGDVVRELIGAFPSLVLAEGDYIAIARHAGKTYQAEFKVASGTDRDVEVPTGAQGGTIAPQSD
ncbi:hypothetical protein P7D22_06920 [Lichenihabitans sp. Uapishka_5]|uniref:hypothetical protein n=1 Tax=Lichenihabitans sp. Uapishka_5 TaxID=3037302 RepID=UPI0029E7F9AF|nr:hypothetical protein [Lichenihabitans sp. Uapishka_5]MDX7950909.1 hypothetical protein [Lichenihabitans sp. Uapishka_5]